jgi:WD40 repeat protein
MTTQRIPLPPQPMTWQALAFNMSGNRMLVRTDKYGIVLDGYEGTVQRIFPCDNSKAMCFTPDDQSVVIGTQNGAVDCWNLASGALVRKLEGHTGPVGAVACNPKYAQLASACSSTCVWIW